MYTVSNKPKIDEIFKKLAKKDPKQLETITNKLQQILQDPHRFKPLSNVMKGLRRVHFGSFVLVYSINEKSKTVVLEDYEHHDKIYGK